ncbi:MAG: DUF1385 domain-containing protein [Candidatus Woesearchaeota archaeon]
MAKKSMAEKTGNKRSGKRSQGKKAGKNRKRDKIFTAGGQAIIEGVMMRTRDRLAMAVRKEDGSIKLKERKFVPISDRHKVLGWPFVRGIINLGEMLVVGIKALTYSANEAMDELEEDITLIQLVVSLVVAIGFALLLFKFVPLLLTQLLTNRVSAMQDYYALFNIVDGIIKIGLFAAYIFFISYMEDIHRVFQYHGAEHKTVNCYEAGKKVNVKNARKFSTLHPRCGTSFILIVLVISIFIYSFIPQSFGFWLKLLSRIILLPFIAGVAYEILKLSDVMKDSRIFNALLSPGLLIERLAVREPDDKQLEVAVKAMKGVVGK